LALAGQGVLAIWNGIAAEAETEFVAWHVREHIPERVGVAGFLRGRRYVAVTGKPKFFNFYETETPDALMAPAYIDRLNTPSDWTRRVVRHFRDTSRTICSVAVSEGAGDGAYVGALRLRGSDAREAAARVRSSIIEPALAEPGIVGVHLLEGRPDPGGQTAEKSLRDRPDRTAAWILLVEATDQEPLEATLTRLASRDALSRNGFALDDDGRGVYRLQYALSREQLR
jgi:hypothetical protein